MGSRSRILRKRRNSSLSEACPADKGTAVSRFVRLEPQATSPSNVPDADELGGEFVSASTSAHLRSSGYPVRDTNAYCAEPSALGGHPKCTSCGHLKMYQGSVGS
jgi:hypothetical protein